MIHLLDRYLIRELIFPFLIALIGFLIFVLLLLLGQASTFLQNQSVSLGTIVQLLVTKVPALLVYAIPSAVSLAIFLSLGRLGHDNEITAFESAGYSMRRILIPILLFASLMSVAGFLIADWVAPQGNAATNDILSTVSSSGTKITIRDDSFFRVGPGRFFYIGHHDSDNGYFNTVVIQDLSGVLNTAECKDLPTTIVAKRASWLQLQWTLFDGYLHCFDSSGRLVVQSDFQTMTINVGMDLYQFSTNSKTSSEMTLSELGEQIRISEQLASNASYVNGLIVDYHLKIAIPVSALVLALISSPLGLAFAKRGRAFGIIAGISLILAYQGTLFITVTWLVSRDILSPALSVWMPNALFGLLGTLLILNMKRLHQLSL